MGARLQPLARRTCRIVESTTARAMALAAGWWVSEGPGPVVDIRFVHAVFVSIAVALDLPTVDLAIDGHRPRSVDVALQFRIDAISLASG
jgi:hypothetical protein